MTTTITTTIETNTYNIDGDEGDYNEADEEIATTAMETKTIATTVETKAITTTVGTTELMPVEVDTCCRATPRLSQAGQCTAVYL